MGEHSSAAASAAPIERRDVVVGVALSLTALVLYLRTLAPGLLPADSGEFQTLANLLGHTHPTGYPTYLLLGKIFTLLPAGTIAYRVNLMSAVMAALAVAGVYLVGRLLTRERWPALFPAAVLAVMPTFWSQALIAEVYSTATLFLTVVLLLLLSWDRSRDPRPLFLAGVAGGLSLGVHLTIALIAPAVVLFLLASRTKWQDWSAAATGALAGVTLALAGFLFVDWHAPPANYFEVVVRPSRSGWGLEPEEIDEPWERLRFSVAGRQFRERMRLEPRRVMRPRASAYYRQLPGEISRITMVLAAIGFVLLVARRPRLALLFASGLAVEWCYSFNYRVRDIYVFYLPGYVLLVLLAGVGLGGLLLGVRWLARGSRMAAGLEAGAALGIASLAAWLLLAPRLDAVLERRPLPFAYPGYPANPFNFTGLHPAAAAIVRALDEDAVLFTNWETLWPLYYVAHIEQGRTDLTFIETFPVVDRPGLAASIFPYIQDQLDAGRPVYFRESLPEVSEAGYRFAPEQDGDVTLYRLYRGR